MEFVRHPHIYTHERTVTSAMEDVCQVSAYALVCAHITVNVAISNNLSRLTATPSSAYKLDISTNVCMYVCSVVNAAPVVVHVADKCAFTRRVFSTVIYLSKKKKKKCG